MFRLRFLILTVLSILLGGLGSSHTSASITHVGNGDDGTDLEGTTRIDSGPVYDSRLRAIDLLKQMNTPGIGGLGTLLPELESSALYLANRNVNPGLPEDQGAFHSDMRGLVFARTFAQPHAATRFFPIASKLGEDQLISLHIHEALHRSLPASVRENESIVSQITLSITAPNSTHDQISQKVSSLLPEKDRLSWSNSHPSPGIQDSQELADKYPIPDDAPIKQPSVIGYRLSQFQSPSIPAAYPVSRLHEIYSFLYPFGSDRVPLGMGIQASLVDRPNGIQMGPLGLSARMRIWSGRGFDVGVWGAAYLNTLSTDEMKNSPLGRDTYTLGVSMEKTLRFLFFRNELSWSSPGQAKQTIGLIESSYNYGSVVKAAVHAGASLYKFRLGGFGEIYLADYFRVNGGAFSFDSGRYRIVSIGPELSWVEKDFTVSVFGRFLIDSTQDANFDYLGNIMGNGVAQGSVGASVSYNF